MKIWEGKVLPFQKQVLDNELRVILAPQDLNEIGIWLMVKAGSQYEKKAESGISHFIEHLVFRGTRKWPTHRMITETLEEISIQNGAHTDLEEISYYLSVKPKYFETALDLVSDLVSAPLFRQEDIGKEKELIAQEIKEELDSPREFVQDTLWREICFGDQPAGRPICGTPESINNFDEDWLKKYFEKTYVGKRMVLAIAGGIKIENVLPKVWEFFKKIKTGKSVDSFPIKDYQRYPRARCFYKDTQQSHFVLGFKTPFRPGQLEAYGAEILAEILSLNIYLLLIGEKGMAYSAGSTYFHDPTKSFLYSFAGVEPSRVEEAIFSILAEYRKLKEGKIDTKDISRAVKSILKRMKEGFSKESLLLARFFGSQELYIGHILTPKEEFERYRSLKTKFIQEIAQKIFKKSNLNLAVVGPHPNQEKFQKLLELF